MQARILNGRYRLDEMIGEGGMAVVYRGYDLVLNRVVAVKLLRDQYATDDSFLKRFEREAQSAARLTHSHIANVYDVGEDHDSRYIVMEYVTGANLKDLIRRQGPFTVEGASFVLRQVAEALDYAHARGLVHRDIKPQNILVDENGNVKVVDFGIAKGLSDSNLTEAGTGMGTVHYVSPEQARGERATPASDIYSTGVVLYEMLTKHLPFEADTPVGVAMQHVSSPPPPPSEFNPTIPEPVDDIVLQVLAKDPRDRFPSAGALAAALEHWDSPYAGARETRVMTAAAPQVRTTGGTRAVGSGRSGRIPPPRAREQTFRDDIGCVTWLIGSAILIGLIGLVVLGFRLGDFSFFDPSPTSTPALSTPTQAAGVPTTATSDGTPTAAATSTTSVASPTAASPATPTAPSGTPTAAVTPTPEPTATPETAIVPSLVGSTVEQAETAVKVGSFQLQIENVFDNVVPAGYIVSQEPRAETRLNKGETIRVRVSRGPEFIQIPSSQGRPVAEVRADLEARGLTVNVVEEASTAVAAGRVIRTDPATQIRNGGTVTIIASVGDKVQVPDVYRVPFQQAIATLEQAGLRVGAATAQSCQFIRQSAPEFNCQTFPDGGVVSGTLQWNSWVDRSSMINIGYYDASTQ